MMTFPRPASRTGFQLPLFAPVLIQVARINNTTPMPPSSTLNRDIPFGRSEALEIRIRRSLDIQAKPHLAQAA